MSARLHDARPMWARPHEPDSRCACWHRGRASAGKVTVDLRHPLIWAASTPRRTDDTARNFQRSLLAIGPVIDIYPKESL